MTSSWRSTMTKNDDDVIKWEHFLRYWPFVRGTLMFSSICAWINGWVNNREAGVLRRHHAHYDVIVLELKLPQFCNSMDWWELWIDSPIKSWTAWHKIRFYKRRNMGSPWLWNSSDLIIPKGIYWNLYRSNNHFCWRKSAESLDQILLIGLLPV